MVYSLFYTNQAEKDLATIDRSVVVQILKKVDYFSRLPDPFSRAKQLRGFEIPTYRFRVGDYRVVFRKNKKTNTLIVLVILSVAHRKEVYSKF